MKILYEPKTKPLPHQLEAINFLVKNEKAALFDEQGVGKTKEVIDAIITMLKEKKVDAAMIIAPKTLIFSWEQEIRKHSYLIPVVLEGKNNKSKGYKFLFNANIFVINYEGVKSEFDTIQYLLDSDNYMLVLDESQRIKNPETETFKCIDKIKKYAKRRYILSGTPVANNPEDLWAQFFFLDNGETLGKSFDLFKKKYSASTITYNKLLELNTLISKKSIRRLKNNVLQLPDKNYQNIEIEFAKRQNEIYLKLKKELLIEIGTMDEKVVLDESKSILKKLLRLVQIASNPGLVVKDYVETPAKFIALDKLVEEVMSRGEKIIIWTNFVGNIMLLKNRYSKLHPLTIYGQIEISKRNEFVNLFQNDQKYKIIIANPAAAREGLTLTAANNAAYIDRSFNLVDYLQSQDRIHRISQGKNCTIYKLLAKDSIDYFIEDKLLRKQDVARLIQGDSVDYNTSNYLTKDEILEILN